MKKKKKQKKAKIPELSLNRLAKITSRSLSKAYEDFKNKQKINRLKKIKLKKSEEARRITKEKKDILADIKKFSEDADNVYFATDPDREGEAISKHIYDILNESNSLKNKTIHRVAFNEITKSAVLDAMKHPREISINLWNAYLARRTLDYLMGYDISEFLWKKVSRDARGGRVQSPALRLIVEREKEISDFKPVEFWTTTVNACHGEDCIDIDLISRDEVMHCELAV